MFVDKTRQLLQTQILRSANYLRRVEKDARPDEIMLYNMNECVLELCDTFC